MSIVVVLLLALAAPEPPIVKGAGLPPPGSDEAAIMAPIDTLLKAIGTRDGAAMLSVTVPDGSATATLVSPDGTSQRRTERWADFVARTTGLNGRMIERLGQPAIEFDEDVAMVWAPYTFTIDGKFSHCGYDHFDLVRIDGRWKILNLTWSKRTTGCASQ